MDIFNNLICGDFVFVNYVGNQIQENKEINAKYEILQESYADVEYCYIKAEEDGDFELIFENENGWYYIQVLGGEVVETIAFISGTDEYDIIEFLGDRISEFKRSEAI